MQSLMSAKQSCQTKSTVFIMITMLAIGIMTTLGRLAFPRRLFVPAPTDLVGALTTHAIAAQRLAQKKCAMKLRTPFAKQRMTTMVSVRLRSLCVPTSTVFGATNTHVIAGRRLKREKCVRTTRYVWQPTIRMASARHRSLSVPTRTVV